MAWNYREVQIEDDKSIGDSGTETIDLNIKDPITSLIVRFSASQASNLDNQPPERQISKIEIVDGGQVYWSLNGPMAVAAATYALRHWPSCWYDARDGSGQSISIPLLFGRYLGDEKYAFNPSSLVNPQLKFTWADQAGYTDGSLTLGVTARVMEGLASPGQALMWKEIEAWTSASSGIHTVDLPVDHPYRALLMRVFDVDDILSGLWTRFKLDCDVGKYIPFDLPYSEFTDILKQLSGPFTLRKFDVSSHNEWTQAWLGETLNILGVDLPGTCIVNCVSAWWSFYNTKITDDSGATKDNRDIQVQVWGHFPHSTMLYPFGVPDSPETWFPSARYGEAKLKITEGIAGGAASVAVQQPRRIP